MGSLLTVRLAASGALLALLALGSPVQAAEKLSLRPGMGGVPDMGAIGCATFNDIYPWGPVGFRQSVLIWAGGYIYGQSGKTMDEVLAAAPPASQPWNFDTLTDHIVGYCQEKPAASVPEAVRDLWLRLKPSSPS